ncbi:MAG: energy transducer TonB [Aquificae bacterium]|nr:energy transducer TonB [Aquificota bacterium]
MGGRELLAGSLLSGALHAGLLAALVTVSLPTPPPEKKEITVRLTGLSVKKEGPAAHEGFTTFTNPYKNYLAHARSPSTTKPSPEPKKEQKKKRKRKKLKKRLKKRTAVKKKAVAKKTVKPKKTKKTALRAVERKSSAEAAAAASAALASTAGAASPAGSSGGPKKGGGGSGRLAYARGAGGGGGGASFISTNYALITELIRKHLEYPYVARRMGWEGKVVVSIELAPSGCKGVRLVSSSGYSVLDQSALRTVKKLCPKFPKPKDEPVVVKVPIAFRLTN